MPVKKVEIAEVFANGETRVVNGYKPVTDEMVVKMKEPLPNEAVKEVPGNRGLSSIKPVYLTERLSEVFGYGSWYTESEVVEGDKPHVVVRTTLHIPAYGIQMESFGGNTNSDKGDSYKGAVTDALSKICSYLGIGMEVFKGQHETQTKQPAQTRQPVGTSNQPPQATGKVTMTEAIFNSTKAAMTAAKSDPTMRSPKDTLEAAKKAMDIQANWLTELELLAK